MAGYYEIPEQKGFFLYAQDGQIFLRQKIAHSFQNPVSLVSDYANSLVDMIYNSTIYFAYINQQGSLIIRSILEQIFPFEIPKSEQTILHSPALGIIGGTLFCLYIEEELDNKQYYMKSVTPYKNDAQVHLSFPSMTAFPHYRFVSLAGEGTVLVESNHQTELFYIDKSTHIRSMFLQQKTNEATLYKLQEEIKQKESQLLDLNQKLTLKENELKNSNTVIDSIKSQYNDLMQVASAYKEEAGKWRSKYTGKS